MMTMVMMVMKLKSGDEDEWGRVKLQQLNQMLLSQISGNSTLSEDWRNRLQEVEEEEAVAAGSNSRHVFGDKCTFVWFHTFSIFAQG